MGMVKNMQIDVMEDILFNGSDKRSVIFERHKSIDWEVFKIILNMLAADGMIETTEDGDIDLTHEGHKRIHSFVQL